MTPPLSKVHPRKSSEPPLQDGAVAATLRKRWFYLLPAVFVTYSLAYLDRANYGFGAAAGLAVTLHISQKQSSLLASLFFLGYLAFQLPGAAFARRYSASRLVFLSLVAWGTCAALTGVIRQFWLLALDRFLLGVAESFIFPAMIFLLTRWFLRAERSRANTLLILGNPVTVLWMSALTGYLIQAVGWQRTFIYEGIPSLLWAFAWVILVRDRPAQTRWMTAEAADYLERILTAEQASVPEVTARTKTVRRSLLRGDVLLLSAMYFFWSLGIYGFILWLPSIVKLGSRLTMGRVGLLSACPYVTAVVLMLVVAHFSDKTQRRESLVWPFLLTAGLALLGSFLLVQRSFALSFVCLVVAGGCMYAPYGPFFAIVPERVSREVTAEVLALINSCGALGGFFGSYFVGFMQAVTGSPRAGFLLMSSALACSAGLLLCMPKLRE